MKEREIIWNKLADWKPKSLECLVEDCKLEELSSKIDQILDGNLRGRVVVDMRS